MIRRVVLVLGALVSTVASAALTAQAQRPLIVAYLESNGELVPIARYDGAGWRNTWPQPIDRDAPLPVRSVAKIPKPPRCKAQFAPLETGTSSGASETDFWRKEEAGDWSGPGWLGWTSDGDTLKPVKMMVRDRPKDLPGLSDDDIYVESIPKVTFAVRCVSGLRAGKIQSAGVVNHDLEYSGSLDVSLGKLRYQVRVEAKDPAAADAKVILAHAGRTQVLYSADGFTDEPHYEVVWAGDLDRDGKLDLVVNLHRKYSWHPYRLLLSTRAAGKDLVGEAAIFETGN